jgi:hypothetical protein
MRALSALLLFTPALVMPAQVQLEMPRAGGVGQAATFSTQYKTILPHVVFGGGWHNRFVFVNYAGNTASVRLYFYGNDGSAMPVPIKQFGTDTYVDVYLQGWGTKVIETDESRRDTLHEGWAKAVVSCSSTPCEDIVMFGIFATVPAPGNPAYEATVFASDSRSNMTMVPFDNRDGFTTGIAVAAHNCAASDPDVRIDFKYADEPGGTFYQFQVPMKCPGHISFSLSAFNAKSLNRMGFVQVFSSRASVAALALLFNPDGPYTTIPPSEYIP